MLYVTCVGIGNIINIAIDNGFFENPLDHSDYGFKYLLGITALLYTSFTLISDEIKFSEKRKEEWKKYDKEEIWTYGRKEKPDRDELEKMR